MAVLTQLRGQKPHNATIIKIREGINHRINKVTIAVTPPQQHGVNNLVLVFVQNRLASDLLDHVTKLKIDILVITELLNKMISRDPHPLSSTLIRRRPNAHVTNPFP